MSADNAPVRRAFAGAAASYDAAAVVQRQSAEHLLAGLSAATGITRIADLGCGTGHGLFLMARQWPGAELLGLDFALPMLKRLTPEQRRFAVCADAEAIPLAPASFDLVWSNLTLQWCNPIRFATEAARLLRPGGRLAIATLGPDTFGELRQAFAGVDGYRHTLDFAAADTVVAAFANAGLQIESIRRESVVRRHPTLRGLLGEVRDIGANRVTAGGRRGLMGKAAWRQFEAGYEALRDSEGLPLGYDLIFLYARK